MHWHRDRQWWVNAPAGLCSNWMRRDWGRRALGTEIFPGGLGMGAVDSFRVRSGVALVCGVVQGTGPAALVPTEVKALKGTRVLKVGRGGDDVGGDIVAHVLVRTTGGGEQGRRALTSLVTTSPSLSAGVRATPRPRVEREGQRIQVAG